MPRPSLPLPAADLARQLSKPLAARRNGLELSVAAAQLIDTGAELALQLDVSIT
jgi:hypothetical protein